MFNYSFNRWTSQDMFCGFTARWTGRCTLVMLEKMCCKQSYVKDVKLWEITPVSEYPYYHLSVVCTPLDLRGRVIRM